MKKPSTVGWIISRRSDLVFFILPNVLGALIVLGSTAFFFEHQIFFFCNLFFTLAHFCPTWIRCYAYRQEFKENRIQLLFFPLCFGALAYFSGEKMVVILFILFFWDRFHGVMQNYGFLRMYDAQAQMKPTFGKRFDLFFILLISLTILVFNMGILTAFLTPIFALGIPIEITPEWVFRARMIMLIVTACATLCYLWDLVRQYRQFGRVNVPKLLFLACVTSGHIIMNNTSSFLLLFTHEKIYHSLQYMVLVWHYNRKKVLKNPKQYKGTFFASLSSRNSLPKYLLVILVWVGAYYALDRRMGNSEFFLKLNVGVALCHYYFDSFIWRIRRKEVKGTLRQ